VLRDLELEETAAWSSLTVIKLLTGHQRWFEKNTQQSVISKASALTLSSRVNSSTNGIKQAANTIKRGENRIVVGKTKVGDGTYVGRKDDE